MAQKQAPLSLVGNVVKSERVQGSFASRDTGEMISYDFIKARVITPEYESLEVRFPSDGITVAVPAKDELVRIELEARVAGGDLRLTAKAVELLEVSPLSI